MTLSANKSTKNDAFSFTVLDSAESVVARLSELSGLSQTRIKHAMACGAVWRENKLGKSRIRRAKVKLQQEDIITFYHNEAVLDATCLEATLLREEKDYSVCYKPRGMTLTGSRFGDHTSLLRWVETNRSDKPQSFTVHRIDRFTAGLVIIAHNKRCAAELSRQFRDREVEKEYRALVKGKLFYPQTIDEPLDDKSAISKVKPLSQNEDSTLVKVEIETGRKHQIRRHLAHLGHPVIGDRQYGGGDDAEDLQLVANAIQFRDMNKDVVAVSLPDDLLPDLNPG